MPRIDTFEDQVARLRKECDDAEQDIISDFGEDVADAGGCYEVWQSMLSQTCLEYPLPVRQEVARMLGVTIL